MKNSLQLFGDSATQSGCDPLGVSGRGWRKKCQPQLVERGGGPKNAGDAGNTASGSGDGYFTAGAPYFQPFLISRPPACSLPLGPGVVSRRGCRSPPLKNIYRRGMSTKW